MGWILGILGAIFGLGLMADSRWVFGFVFGGLVGALLGVVIGQRSRLAALDQRLARLEAGQRRQAIGAEAAPSGVAAPAAPAVAAREAAPAPGASAAAPVAMPPAGSPDAEGATAGPATPPPAAAQPAAAAPPPAAARVPDRPAEPAPPPGPGVFERLLAVAKGWLFEGNVPVKIGLLVLMFGVASALKYASDAGWLVLPIELRLAGIAAAAIGGLVWGLRSAAERPAFGLSLQGGAIGVLLLVVFAAFRYYGVLPAMPAFLLVIVLVAGASVLAVRQNAAALAVLGFIGGYLAPVLISTGSGNHVALFSYYAVLNAAVFGIAWHRPWRALNLVGFVFTFAIGGLWGAKYYEPSKFATVEPFLVLFFLFYVALPVLYALAGRGRQGKVDGTLLFGTPLLAFPMQVGLLGDNRFGLAASAVFVAAIYTGLALWARRNQRLRDLAQSSAGMGVAFATLAIPMALSARWTSSAWALQAVLMVWLGLRQQRRWVRWSGLGLLVLAGVAWIVGIVDTRIDRADALVLNGHALSLFLVAASAFACGWLYDRAGANRVVAILLFFSGLFWWLVLGTREIVVNLEPDSYWLAFGGYFVGSAALAALLRRPLAWPRLGWAVSSGVLAMALFSLPGALDEGRGLLDWPLLGWWAAFAVALVALRALREPPSRTLPTAHIAWLSALALVLGGSLMRVLHDDLGARDGWLLPAMLAPLAALFVLAWRRPALAGWPMGDRFPGWRAVWLAIAGAGLGLGWVLGNFLPGDSAPLPWLPVLNPLELSLLLGLLGAAVALRRQRDPHRLGALAWAAAALFMLTMAVLRASHQLADLPWSPTLLGETIAQASLTVAWCVAGMAAWILGSRRRDRPLWWLGAVLLGIVLLKLLAVDRLFVGDIAGIVSFVVVGLLLIAVGRIAPTPPRSE